MSYTPNADILRNKMKTKWRNNTRGKGRVLVENLTAVVRAGVNPMRLAASKDRKAIAKLRQVFESGLWRQILESVPVELYLDIVNKVSAQAYDAAVEAKAPKYESFADAWAPLLASHVAKIRSMPDETDAQREARMLENLRGLKKLKGAWRRGGAATAGR